MAEEFRDGRNDNDDDDDDGEVVRMSEPSEPAGCGCKASDVTNGGSSKAPKARQRGENDDMMGSIRALEK